MNQINHIGLFEGIGGFSLAAYWAGIHTVAWVENDKNRWPILRKHYPNAKEHYDIKEFDGKEFRGQIHVVTGGFPCQDISIANSKAKGIGGTRSRLWFEMLRVIGEIRPQAAIIENSSRLVVRGLDTVLCGLAQIGYDAEWQCVSGHTFGVQQRRERIYICAYPHSFEWEGKPSESLVWAQSPKQPLRVAPGWRKRRDIPTPRTIRSANDVPNGLHRVRGIGNAVIPIIPYYLYECFKKRLILNP